jgi:hypothetical protein
MEEKNSEKNCEYCLNQTNNTLTFDYDYFKNLHPKYNDDVINLLVKASADKFIDNRNTFRKIEKKTILYF